MRVLLFSTVIYLAGIAVVLFLRPALMFDKEGRWKEFGLQRGDATVFPFWLFCITWAFASYFLGRLSLPSEPTDWVQSASTAARVATAASGLHSTMTSLKMVDDAPPSQPSSANMVTPLPVNGPTAQRRRRGPVVNKFGQLKQLGGGRKQLPKGLYFYVGGGEEEESGEDTSPFSGGEEEEAEM